MDRTARNHGLQKVGLPSRQAIFEQDSSVTMLGRRGWWDGPGKAAVLHIDIVHDAWLISLPDKSLLRPLPAVPLLL